MKYIIVIFTIIVSFQSRSQLLTIKDLRFSVEFEQVFLSPKKYMYFSETEQYLNNKIYYIPSIKFGIGIEKKNIIKHSIFIGYNSYSMQYSQEAVDVFYQQYPTYGEEQKKLYYFRSFDVTNFVIGYKYLFNIRELLSVYFGVDFNIPLLLSSNNETYYNSVIGYHYSGGGVVIKTLHDNYYAKLIDESFLESVSLPIGVDYFATKNLSFGLSLNYKYNGNLLASDFLDVFYRDSESTYYYSQKVYMYNSFLNFSIKMKYLF